MHLRPQILHLLHISHLEMLIECFKNLVTQYLLEAKRVTLVVSRELLQRYAVKTAAE